MLDLIINRVFIFIILMVMGFFYNRFLEKYDYNDETKNAQLIRNFLLNETDIARSSLPILWIHVPYEINARKWKSFYSRTSKDLNLSYIQLTISSIIKHCGNDFKICLIDDTSFKTLIPEWQHNLETMGSPVKEKMRLLAKLKLIKYYGGMFVPSSFLCLQSLKPFMEDGCVNNLPFVVEKTNSSLVQSSFVPGLDFFGARKDNEIICKMVTENEKLISKDVTSESDIVGTNETYLYELNRQLKINIVDGKLIGIKDSKMMPIKLEHLFSTEFIQFDPSLYGIYINHAVLAKRHAYNWFCKFNEHEIFNCDTILCKYFLLANSVKNI